MSDCGPFIRLEASLRLQTHPKLNLPAYENPAHVEWECIINTTFQRTVFSPFLHSLPLFPTSSTNSLYQITILKHFCFSAHITVHHMKVDYMFRIIKSTSWIRHTFNTQCNNNSQRKRAFLKGLMQVSAHLAAFTEVTDGVVSERKTSFKSW